MPGLKRACQSFTFEYKLKVIPRADEIDKFLVPLRMTRVMHPKSATMNKA